MRRAYPQYRDSGVEWLGDVPAHWDVTAVKRNYQITLGKMLQGDPIDCDDVETPYLKALHVQWTGLHIDDAPTMWANPGEIRHFSLTEGDLLVCEGGEGGRSCLLPAGFERYIIQNSLHRVRPRGYDSNAYLCYVLACISDRGWFSVISDRATISHFTREKFASLVVPLPPIDEQRAIAAFLDRETARIDTLVEKNRLLIERLAEYRTALITRAVTRGLDPAARLKPSGVEWLGDVPAHWDVRKLKSVTSCLDGERIPLNAEQRADRQGEFPYWGANGILDHLDDWLFDETLVLLGEDGAPFFSANKQVAFAVSGRIWVNNHAHVLRPTGIEQRYLAHLLNIADYTEFVEGSTRDKLTQGDMNNIPVLLPPPEEQELISSHLFAETSAIDGLADKAEAAIERLHEYRAALITAAVTGKIDVREPERAT